MSWLNFQKTSLDYRFENVVNSAIVLFGVFYELLSQAFGIIKIVDLCCFQNLIFAGLKLRGFWELLVV